MTEPSATIETLEGRSPALAVEQDPANPTAPPLLVLFGEKDLVCIDEMCVPRDGAE